MASNNNETEQRHCQLECPEEKAGLWARVTYSWLNALVALGYKRPLEEEDLYSMGQKFRAERNLDLFLQQWHKDQEQEHAGSGTAPKVEPSVARSLWHTVGRTWALSGVLKLISDIATMTCPILLQRLIETITSPHHASKFYTVFLYCASIFVMQMLASFCVNYYFLRTMTCGLRVRTALSAAIYAKALRLSSLGRQKFSTGQIVNLMSTDAPRIDAICGYLHYLWSGPIQIIVILTLLLNMMGPSALAGFGVLLVIFPMQALLMKYLTRLRREMAQLTDQRVKATQEILNGIRVIKLYAWEKSFLDRILGLRTDEMTRVRRYAYARSFVSALVPTMPAFAAITSFILYKITYGRLEASIIFPAFSLFNLLRIPLILIPVTLSSSVDAYVALGRIQAYLSAPELSFRPTYLTSKDDNEAKDTGDKGAKDRPDILIENGSFLWDELEGDKGKDENDRETSASKEEKKKRSKKRGIIHEKTPLLESASTSAASSVENLPSISALTPAALTKAPTLRNINLSIPKGSLVAVVGPVGSGKSSLLNAMVGEMTCLQGSVCYGAPRVGYCPQEAWIRNATLQRNITFGQPFNAERYQAALEACALTRDLAVLPQGDQTEIGEKGINLSGGQKQRINLARAVYYNADICLLDDPLSAVDAHVGRHLFEACVLGALGGKTRVLVTHQLHVLSQCDYIVHMRQGEVLEQGTYTELMSTSKGAFAALIEQYGGATSEEEGDQEVALAGKAMDEEPETPDEIEVLLVSPTPSGLDCVDAAFREEGLGGSGSHSRALSSSTIRSHSPSNNTTLLRRSVGRKQVDAKNAATAPTGSTTKALMTEEERAIGSVEGRIYWLYAKACGGLVALACLFASSTLYQCARLGTDSWLAIWSGLSTNATTPLPANSTSSVVPFLPDHVTRQLASLDDQTFMLIYIGWGLALMVFAYAFGITFAVGGTKAASRLHRRALDSVMSAPMSFFETTPLGRIVNRFSKDQDAVDNILSESARMFTNTLMASLGIFTLIIMVTKYFIIPLVPMLILYYLVQRYYRATSRELKRIDAVSRSPLYAHFSETLTGLATIRAYREEAQFRAWNQHLIDQNNRPLFLQLTAQRWIGLRLEAIGNLLVLAASLACVLLEIPPNFTGLVIGYALSVTGMLNWCVRQAAEMENQMNAVERLSHYASALPAEPAWHLPTDDSNVVWPSEGDIVFDQVSLRYRPELPISLHALSFHIRPCEKVAIVGRTGAGKSTILSALFRLVDPCEGVIRIDGVDITHVGLHHVRRGLAIIPQDPVLYSGTIRSNLDPFGEYSDPDIWHALSESLLKDVVAGLSGQLEALVSENGDNFSVGQRQLLCLARALLRRAKVIVLDEATANVDAATDAFIQSALRRSRGSTMLTIAHRLATVIDYDRVMVMEHGTMVELDAPLNLLYRRDAHGKWQSRDDTMFAAMVEETGIKNATMLRSIVLEKQARQTPSSHME